jgi:predicted chitinase
MISKYEQASNTRKRGVLGTITDRLVAGQGFGKSIGGGISESFKAKTTGLKEKFDPLNLAKMLTGNLGMAFLGNMTGRKPEDMQYFLNKGRKKGEKEYSFAKPQETKVGNVETAFYSKIREGQKGSLQKGDNVATVASRLVNVIKTFYEKENLIREIDYNFEEEVQAEDARRHQSLIDEIKKIKDKKPIKSDIEKVKKDLKIEEEPKKPETPSISPLTPSPTTTEPSAATTAATTVAAAPIIATVISKAKDIPVVSSVISKAEKIIGPTKAAPKITKEIGQPTVATGEAAKATKISTPSVGGAAAVGGTAAVIAGIGSALAEVGVTNEYAQKAILGNVGKESEFIAKSEDSYANTSNDRIRKIFGSRVAGLTDDQLNEIKKDDSKFFETVYGYQTAKGQELGNKEPGDGFKYRGRGLIQLTGKDNYNRIGKQIGADLVSNPDLVNDPVLAPKIVAAFVKNKLGSRVNSFKSQSEANNEITKAIVGASVDLTRGFGAEQMAKVEAFTSSPSGEAVYAMSKQNQELKEQVPVTNLAVNNTKTIINTGGGQSRQIISTPVMDDSPLLATTL